MDNGNSDGGFGYYIHIIVRRTHGKVAAKKVASLTKYYDLKVHVFMLCEMNLASLAVTNTVTVTLCHFV